MNTSIQRLLWVFAVAFMVHPVAAQSYLADPYTAERTGFGGAAAVGDGEIIVGSVSETIKDGELYLYRKDSGEWMETGRIKASDGTTDNRFGRALAIHGSTLLVGATAQDDSRGAAYIFNKDDNGVWQETAKLVPAEVEQNFGRTLALNDNFAFAATLSKGDSKGAVFVFHNEGDNVWKEHSVLMPDDLTPGDFFGWSMSLHGDKLVVAAPGLNREEAAGAAYVFEYEAATNSWKQTDKLEMEEMSSRSWFGYSVYAHENYVVVGAPNAERGMGAVYTFMQEGESGTWQPSGRLTAFDGRPGTMFGSHIAETSTGLWVGAPRGSNGTGTVYNFDFDAEAAMWLGTRKLHPVELKRGSSFGTTFAVHGNVALIGASNADSGLGLAYVFERAGDESEWQETSVLMGEEVSMDPVSGEMINCEEGAAVVFDCESIDLMSFTPIADLGGIRGARLNDIWGWEDPETGIEYALVGRTDGTSFVDISNPTNPVLVGTLPLTEGANPATWRDIKVYEGYAFIVADGSGQHGMQVFDLSKLRDAKGGDMPHTFTADALYDEVASVHNIVINEETGYAYAVGSNSGGETCGGGLHMINIQDQTNPTFAGCFADSETGRSGTGYTHDAQCVNYSGPDAEHQGKEICFNSNETALSIADVSDKENTIALSNASYPNVAYAHQGWLTEDQKFFYMNDELDEMNGYVGTTRTLIWDVQDLDDPQLLKEFVHETEASDHNLYIKGNLMYQSNYNSGLRIFDITDVENPVPAGHFDTNPFAEEIGFDGSWSNFPYFKSGVIAVSSIGQGLFLVKKSNIDI